MCSLSPSSEGLLLRTCLYLIFYTCNFLHLQYPIFLIFLASHILQTTIRCGGIVESQSFGSHRSLTFPAPTPLSHRAMSPRHEFPPCCSLSVGKAAPIFGVAFVYMYVYIYTCIFSYVAICIYISRTLCLTRA